MKSSLTTAFVALLIAANPTLCFAAETDGGATTETITDMDSDQPPASSETSSEQSTPQEEKSDDKKGPHGDLLQNFQRHRPGACPEGPPCKDGD